jgi:UrcA family protein
MMETNNWKILAAGIATMAVLFGSAGLALAQGTTVLAPRADDALTERVSYADLNLASAAGRKRLEFRVDHAVGKVCPSGTDIREALEGRSCAKAAWAGARPQMERAFARAIELASTGTTTIAPVAIAIIAPPPR